jgi:two-component system phosphate regulon response regulator PhoB
MAARSDCRQAALCAPDNRCDEIGSMIEAKSHMKPQIMIVEDEASFVTMLRYNLEKADFTVCEACNGEEALLQITERKPDIVLLDWGLPLVSGFEVCRQIRSSPDLRSIPVIMLTARGEEADKVRALDAGADDYITKPFSVSELIARLRAVLRRAKPGVSDKVLSFAGIMMDLAVHRVTRNGRPVHLGPTEYRLLRFFLERPRRVFSREQLLDAVWGYDIYVESRTVDVHIRRLRNAMNAAGDPDLIRTVRSAGYALEEIQQCRPPRNSTPRVASG